jgi:tetratricopeptide (TPR) repeat protein
MLLSTTDEDWIKGDKEFGDGNYEEAIEHFQEFARTEPSNGYHLMAQCYNYLGNVNMAIYYFNKAIDEKTLYFSEGESYAMLGDLYKNSGLNKEAIAQYKAALVVKSIYDDEVRLNLLECQSATNTAKLHVSLQVNLDIVKRHYDNDTSIYILRNTMTNVVERAIRNLQHFYLGNTVYYDLLSLCKHGYALKVVDNVCVSLNHKESVAMRKELFDKIQKRINEDIDSCKPKSKKKSQPKRKLDSDVEPVKKK